MDITALIEAGGTNPVLLFVFALVLGALHGLEPGHSKTMMAAYIIAIQGTVWQAVLLGLSAAFSHSIIVWILAAIALTYGNELIGEQLEPWFMIISGALVLCIAGWMLWSGLGARRGPSELATAGPGGAALAHAHDHAATGHNRHHYDHSHADAVFDVGGDAHARAHASEIRQRLAAGRVGPWQTILFGLTGGLIPCPAAITVVILCLHLGQVLLGITLVSAFSVGLAATLVAIGIVAALGLKVVSSRTSRLNRFFEAAPYISGGLIALIGVAIIWSGIDHLSHAHV
ncbi:MAG: nickel/cobalt efflux transporter [Pseudomonadota bacterium]